MNSGINRCYRTLELEPGASLDQVKQAWRELVKVWHPDRFPNDAKLQRKAQERLKEINGAYGILEKYLTSNTPPPRSRPTSSQSSETNEQRNESKRPSTTSWGMVAILAVIVVLVIFKSSRMGGSNQERAVQTDNPRPMQSEPQDASHSNQRLTQDQEEPVRFFGSSDKWNSKSISEIEKGANEGNRVAQAEMAQIYDMGDYRIKQDSAKAAFWYRKAAEQGSLLAQNNLGILYFKGEGVPKDQSQASLWLTQAAEQGDPYAQRNLALHYLCIGHPDSRYGDAAKWFLRSAEGRNFYSQFDIARLYEAGLGILKTPTESLKWYYISAARGYEPARQAANNLEARLSQSQVADAMAKAKAFNNSSKRQ